MERIILHLDMDAFFAQIEEKRNPRFKGKPIVVGADPKNGKGRGVVSTANYEARKYGIRSALPISEAWRRCPTAVFLPPDMEFYGKISSRIMDIVKKYSPQWEVVGVDEAYSDLSSLKDWREAESAAVKIKKEILEKENLTSTAGIGPNKLIAKMASQAAKPDGLLVVTLDQTDGFLEPLDIENLPGVGPKTAGKLRALGINKIKELKLLPMESLRALYGKTGEMIYQRALGMDESPVTSEEVVKSIGKEHTFDEDTRDPEIIFGTFENLIKRVYGEISENNFHFRNITVVCRFLGFETHTKAKTLKEISREFKILRSEAKKLLLRFLVENPKPVRLIGLRVKIARCID